MSDSFIRIIPVEPTFVPTKRAQKAAAAVLRAAAPKADEVSSEADEQITFRDAGGNFDRVGCPACRKEIAVETWQEWMDAAYSDAGGFRLAPLITPCCKRATTLNDLDYDMPQGFSRYELRAMNIDKELPSTVLKKLEGVLGCKLRVIHQRI